MNWAQGTIMYDNKIAFFNGLFFLGMCIGTFSINLLKNLSQRKLFMIVNLVSIVVVASACLNIEAIFIMSRFLLGYACGISRPLSSIWLHELSPNSVRPTSVAKWGLVSKVACVSFFFLSNLDDNGPYIWKIIFVIQVIPLVIFIILGLTIYKDYDSLSYLMAKNKESQARSMLGNYMDSENVEEMIDEYKKVQKKHNDFLIDENGNKVNFVKMIYKNYLHEFFYATLISLVFLLTQKTTFWAFYQKFIIKDQNNQSEKKIAVFVTSLTKVATLIAIALSAKFKINKFRKTSWVIGCCITGLTWIVMGVCFYFDFYAYIVAMISAFIFAILDGISY